MAKKVVVVGGGFAGSYIAKQLAKHTDLIDLTLIDTKEFFEHTPEVLREMVIYAVNDGNIENEIPSTVLEHHAYLHPKGKLVVGEVVDVSQEDVTVNVITSGLVNNETAKVVESRIIEYDFLCICTGNSYTGFIKTSAVSVSERHHEYKKQGLALKNAETVLVIGGGPVGVELAADILEKYPNKEVTLVSSGSSLLHNSPQQAQATAHQHLENCGARLLYNQTVNTLQLPHQESYKLLNRSYLPLHFQNMEGSNIKYTTSKGIIGTAEKMYFCAGGSPRTSFMLKNFFSQLDDDFRLQVNDYLQLEGYINIFAAGDITHFKEEKLAERALKQAEVVVENILNLSKGLIPRTKYIVQQNSGFLVISLGKEIGSLCLWGEVVASGRVAASAKESFFSYHSATLLSNERYAPIEGPKMLMNSATVMHKVAQCTSRIAVLGHGGLSTEVVKYLVKCGTTSVVVIVPSGTRVRLSEKIRKKGVQIFEWDSSDSLLETLQGIDTVLLTCVVGISMVSECVGFIQACKAAEVKFIVKCTQGAMDADSARYDLADWNRQIEDSLRNSGIPYCIIRHAHSFTSLRIFAEQYVKLFRILTWPFGEKKIVWIDMQDVVLAVCAVLVDAQAHISQCYTLTGAVQLSAEDILHELSIVVKEPLQLVHTPPDFIYNQLTDFGIPANLAGTLVQSHTLETERSPSTDFLTLTGQLPTPIHVWLRANIQRFSTALSQSNSSKPITPRSVLPPAGQSTQQGEPNNSNTPIGQDSLDKVEDDTDNFIFSSEFQSMMDLRAFNRNTSMNFRSFTLSVPEGNSVDARAQVSTTRLLSVSLENLPHSLSTEISPINSTVGDQIKVDGNSTKYEYPTTPSSQQQIPQSPLIPLGFFDIKFREALKEHFISSNMARMCPWVDFIIDITKFKCTFEGNMPVPPKHAITADIYHLVNTRKKRLFGSNGKTLREGDPRFAEAKSRAHKTLAKYRATNSPYHIALSGKYREKLGRAIVNQVSQSFFDKVQALAWTTLEAEIPRFLPSIEQLCIEESAQKMLEKLKNEHNAISGDGNSDTAESELVKDEEAQSVAAKQEALEKLLIAAPASIALLAHLCLVSSTAKDFKLQIPLKGFQHVKSEWFRGGLMQVVNMGAQSFALANKNVASIEVLSSGIPNSILDILQLVLHSTRADVKTLLPEKLAGVVDKANRCAKLASGTEEMFDSIVALINELAQTFTATRSEIESQRSKKQGSSPVEIYDANIGEVIDTLMEGLKNLVKVRLQWTKLTQFFTQLAQLIRIEMQEPIANFKEEAATNADQVKQDKKLFALAKETLRRKAREIAQKGFQVNLITVMFLHVSQTYLQQPLLRLDEYLALTSKDVALVEQLQRDISATCAQAQKEIEEKMKKTNEETYAKFRAEINAIEKSANLEKRSWSVLSIFTRR